jgi:uncharacterized membrane protein
MSKSNKVRNVILCILTLVIAVTVLVYVYNNYKTRREFLAKGIYEMEDIKESNRGDI